VHDIMLSVIMVIKDRALHLSDWLEELHQIIKPLARDYEIIVVDNGSSDDGAARLETLATKLPNLQVYCLSTSVRDHIALVAGLEQAIGDYMLVFDPRIDDPGQIAGMLIEALERGNDVVLARALDLAKDHWLYDIMAQNYIRLFRLISGFDLRADSPQFRLLSRRVVNYILQHDDTAVMYQVIPVASGFKRCLLEYHHQKQQYSKPTKTIPDGFKRGLALMVGSSTIPMRLAALTALCAAFLSLLYSIYVVGLFFFKDGVMPGWTTLSLQMSGMFFLLSLAIAILAEYVVHISGLSARRPPYHIAREFRSNNITRLERLNIVSTRLDT